MKMIYKGMDCKYREVQEVNGTILGMDGEPLNNYDGAFYRQITEDEAEMLIVSKEGSILHNLGISGMPDPDSA